MSTYFQHCNRWSLIANKHQKSCA